MNDMIPQKMQYSANNSNVRKSTNQSSKNIQNTNSSNIQTTSLPTGWKREENLKQTGLYGGKTDICYISPTGQRIKSKEDLQQALGSNYDVLNFDWKSGKFGLNRKRTQIGPEESPSHKMIKLVEEHTARLTRSGKFNFNMDKKVSVETSIPNTTNVKDEKEVGELPCQLLWYKRLAEVQPFNPKTDTNTSSIQLPDEIQNAGIAGMDNNQLFQSIVSCIYNYSKTNVPVVGQNQQKSNIEKNPCLSLTASQPLIKQVIITDEIIHRQEAKVKDLRKKLERVRRTLLPKLNVGDAA